MIKYFSASLYLFILVASQAWAGVDESDVRNSTPVRAVHFVMAPSGSRARALDYLSAVRLIETSSRAGLNTAIVQIANSVVLDSVPQLVRPGAWTKQQFIDFVNMAKSRGMEIIPEIKLLSHQDKLFQSHFPHLMFNQTTYDPNHKATYEVVFTLLNEIIDAVKPRAIHIGHDEVSSPDTKKKWLKQGEEMLPANLFLQDVWAIRNFLAARKVETWMWGDMLISRDEFPDMSGKHLHGSKPGYGKSLRVQLPKDVVICDWHYVDDQSNFTSLQTFRREGFRVLGVTWKKEKTIRNFSRYAAEHGAEGMIATTWFHVPRNEWDVVERIIRTSGRIFIKDFPDAR